MVCPLCWGIRPADGLSGLLQHEASCYRAASSSDVKPEIDGGSLERISGAPVNGHFQALRIGKSLLVSLPGLPRGLGVGEQTVQR